jgi:hypothetical protein
VNTAAIIPAQRIRHGGPRLTALEVEALEPVVAKAGVRLRAAIDLYGSDPVTAVACADDIASWVGRMLLELFGEDRVERLDMPEAMVTLNDLINNRAGVA